MPKATRVKTCFVRMKSQYLKFDNGITDINEFITVYGSFSSYCKMAKKIYWNIAIYEKGI